MYKVLLIETDEYRDFFLPGVTRPIPYDFVQPLGLLLLAAILREKDPSVEIKILDTRIFKRDYSKLPDAIKEFNPDLTGIRTVSQNELFMHRVAKEVKEIYPDRPIILGGPHITAAGEKAMSDVNIDIGVYGEGDKTFPLLVERLRNNEDYRDIKGIMYRDNGKIHRNPPQDYVEDLDTLPFPAWDLIDMEPYFKAMYSPFAPVHFNARRELVSIFTSRGCPYDCSFCHNIFGKKVRFQSPEKVLYEMKRLYDEFGIRQFDIRDDIFNINKKRAHKICDMIIESGMDINISFPNGLRGDIMDEELILKLRAAGTHHITYALESASPRIQALMRKNIDLDKLKKMIKFTSDQGIIVRLFVILGYPSETKEEMMATSDYVMDPSVDYVNFHVFNPFEGTDAYKAVENSGVDTSRFEGNYDYYRPNFSASAEMTVEEFREIHTLIVHRFFNDSDKIFRAYNKWKTFHKPPGNYSL